MSKVAIVKGNNRKQGIKTALELVEADIKQKVREKGSDTLFVKVNLIDAKFPDAITHPQALEAVLEFFQEKFPNFKRILVGDNSFAFKKKGWGNPYKGLKKRFPRMEFSSLEGFGEKELEVESFRGKKSKVRASLLPRKAFSVSLALPKTHDTFVFTGAVKNMFGCVLGNRPAVHGIGYRERVFLKRFVKSNRVKNQNMALALAEVMPDLAVLDGWHAMEGNGPILGTAINFNTAMASVDAIATDALFNELMGLPLATYLPLLEAKGLGTTDLKEIDTLEQGFEDLNQLKQNVKPHYLTEFQLMPWDKKLLGPKIDWKIIASTLKRRHRLKEKAIDFLKNLFHN